MSRRYRVIRASIVGGVYRRPGEVIEIDPARSRPGILEALDGNDQPEAPANETKGKAKPGPKGKAKPGPKGKSQVTGKPAPVLPEDGPSVDEIGGGEKINAEDVTSADMIKEA